MAHEQDAPRGEPQRKGNVLYGDARACGAGDGDGDAAGAGAGGERVTGRDEGEREGREESAGEWVQEDVD